MSFHLYFSAIFISFWGSTHDSADRWSAHRSSAARDSFKRVHDFNLVQRALVLEDYAPTLGVGGLLVGKRVQEVWEKKIKKGKIIIND